MEIGRLPAGEVLRGLNIRLGQGEVQDGTYYEYLFELMLKRLVQEEFIDSWKKTERESQEDKNGIDYYISFQGKWYPWQVTSSRKNAWEHSKTHEAIRSGAIGMTYFFDRNKERINDGDVLENIKLRLLSTLEDGDMEYTEDDGRTKG